MKKAEVAISEAARRVQQASKLRLNQKQQEASISQKQSKRKNIWAREWEENELVEGMNQVMWWRGDSQAPKNNKKTGRPFGHAKHNMECGKNKK